MAQTYSPVENAEEKAGNGKRAPGRPRSEDARKAILRSTLKLLQETGFPDLSIEAIAADADVGKATVYRWWPNKASLVAEAFSRSADEELRFPNTGSVRDDVSIQMKHLVRVLRGRRGRIVAALIGGGQSDPELIQAFRDRFMLPRRQEAYQTLRRGIARRELPEDLDLDLTLDTLYGSLYMRFLIRQTGLTDDYVDEVVALVFDGAAMRA
ncbi:MAG TPA: TetR/AcrR family transcriptional regulator [Terriglobales bacterium]|jgi:AcrR family transcriptional regulator|nr:TetR/AcrR family transcriptional regulator [Terriglobales bacterium]